jgi:acyl transferase domain-containing protein
MGCPRNKVAVSPEGSAFEEDPIAICGFALKFPQEAATEEAFWTMLVEKRSAMTEFPPDRMNINGFYHPSRSQSLRTRGAHFILEDVGAFDADFFSITPSVAAAMDPMQRLLLETAFHAFESAGIPIESIRGSRTSVHTGCFSNDYLQQILKDSERLPPYAAIGASQSMLANRLSWFYDLRGPSVNLDSACSSSAMAVDLACQLLHSGRTDMAVVAGCNLLLDPDFSRILSDMQMLSPDGLCYAFDHRANGYSRGEGIAVVVLKRLSSALQNNDTIRAVIRASGSSQDGRTAGITQPDAQAQLQLIRETYQHAGLSLEHTRFFEAHGTGTEIGDPVEISAIATAFQDHRTPADPLYVGSVKTNIGHLEGASGIAGLIKAILVVESGTIPPNANFESINRRLASYDHVVSFPGKPIEWPSCKIRRASINSFGYGGSNCHIVIDDAYSYLHGKGLAPKALTITRPTMDPSSIISNIQFQDGSYILPTTVSLSSPMSESPKLLVWSAATEAATRRLISDWQKYYNKASRALSTVTLSNIAYTLDSRRSSLRFTAYAVISSAADLENISQHASAPTERPRRNPRVAFLFTGQGAQWHAMGRELFMFPKFANGLDESDAVLAEFGSRWNIRGKSAPPEKHGMTVYVSTSLMYLR